MKKNEAIPQKGFYNNALSALFKIFAIIIFIIAFVVFMKGFEDILYQWNTLPMKTSFQTSQ